MNCCSWTCLEGLSGTNKNILNKKYDIKQIITSMLAINSAKKDCFPPKTDMPVDSFSMVDLIKILHENFRETFHKYRGRYPVCC